MMYSVKIAIESTLLKRASRVSLKINLMFNTLRTYETNLSVQIWSAEVVKRVRVSKK